MSDFISNSILSQMAKIGQPRVTETVSTLEQPIPPIDLSILPMLLYFLMQGQGQGQGNIPPVIPEGLGQATGGMAGPDFAQLINTPVQPGPDYNNIVNQAPGDLMSFLGYSA